MTSQLKKTHVGESDETKTAKLSKILFAIRKSPLQCGGGTFILWRCFFTEVIEHLTAVAPASDLVALNITMHI